MFKLATLRKVDSKHRLCIDTDTFLQKLYACSLLLSLRASIWFVATPGIFSSRFEKINARTQLYFVESKHRLCSHTVIFLLSMLSVTSLTASIAFVYTLPTFLRKSSVQTNAKTCWENPNPLNKKSHFRSIEKQMKKYFFRKNVVVPKTKQRLWYNYYYRTFCNIFQKGAL